MDFCFVYILFSAAHSEVKDMMHDPMIQHTGEFFEELVRSSRHYISTGSYIIPPCDMTLYLCSIVPNRTYGDSKQCGSVTLLSLSSELLRNMQQFFVTLFNNF